MRDEACVCGRAQVNREIEEDMDVRGGGAAAEDARVTRAGYESEDDEAARPLRHCDHDMPDAQPHAVRAHGPATLEDLQQSAGRGGRCSRCRRRCRRAAYGRVCLIRLSYGGR